MLHLEVRVQAFTVSLVYESHGGPLSLSADFTLLPASLLNDFFSGIKFNLHRVLYLCWHIHTDLISLYHSCLLVMADEDVRMVSLSSWSMNVCCCVSP